MIKVHENVYVFLHVLYIQHGRALVFNLAMIFFPKLSHIYSIFHELLELFAYKVDLTIPLHIDTDMHIRARSALYINEVVWQMLHTVVPFPVILRQQNHGVKRLNEINCIHWRECLAIMQHEFEFGGSFLTERLQYYGYALT